MIRPILKYGAPELENNCQVVTEFDDGLKVLAQDMLESMYRAVGVGLAAPQLGVNVRLIVVDPTAGQERGHQIILVNPEIVTQSGQQIGKEGCLSFPDIILAVERPVRAHIKGQTLTGNAVELEAEDLIARILCHEIDHLDGVLFVDRVSALKRVMIRKRIRKLMKVGKW
jgi:peptide deformylase